MGGWRKRFYLVRLFAALPTPPAKAEAAEPTDATELKLWFCIIEAGLRTISLLPCPRTAFIYFATILKLLFAFY